MFLIAFCRPTGTGDKWQSRALFLSILDPRSSIVDNVFDCRLPCVFIFKDGATTVYKIRVHAINSAAEDQPYTFACDTSQLTDDTVSAGPLTVAG